MEKEILECFLKRDWKQSSIERVISVEGSPAVGKFLNFLSTVTRMKIRVVLGNGKVANKSLIMKVVNIPSHDLFEAFHEKYCAFQIETMMYLIVLKEMEHLMDEFEDTDGLLWCHLVHHIPYTCLVLEDLKVLGFNMIERTVFFDLEHCLLAVNSLGRYHGMCKVLEERGVVSKESFKPWFIFDHMKTHEYLHLDMTSIKRAIKILWDPMWGPIVDSIDITADSLHHRLKKLGELDNTKFNVLNHGDCNKNNLLFKYHWGGHPTAMRMLDFQLAHYGSPCIDLTYMLYLSAKPSIRRENLDLMLTTYHDSLIRTLNRFHFSGKTPDIDEIRDGMEKYSFLGLWLFIAWYPPMLKSDKMDELLDYTKIRTTGGLEGHNIDLYKHESMESDLGPDLQTLVQKLL